MVQINGITQVPTSSYTIVGTTLTFTEPPEAGDTIEVREIVAQKTVHAITNSSGNASVSVDDASAHVEITGNLIPSANVEYNLGSPTAQWKDLYLSGNTLYLGGTTLSSIAGNLSVAGNINIGTNYLYGNGYYLTGISGSGGVANLSGNLAGNILANGFYIQNLTDLSVNGNTTLGNASGDTITLNANTANVPNNLTFNGTGAITVPKGTDAEQPGTPTAGMVRFNTTTNKFEGYDGTEWGPLGGGNKTDTGLWQNAYNITENQTIEVGYNASSVGPITIDGGISVTVPTGSTWLVL